MQGILTDNAELKKLILENLDLPLLAMATESANSGEWDTEIASCKFRKGTVLDVTDDCLLPRDDRVYTDETDLRDDIRDMLDDDDNYAGFSDGELDREVDSRMDVLAPYWKDCIFIIVDAF